MTDPVTIWTILTSFMTGFFSFIGNLFTGLMSNDVTATLVIGIPVFGILTAIALGIVGLAKKRKKGRR